MPGPDHSADLMLLADAARASGDIAMRFWKQNPQVWDKGADGPVTEADFAVNDMLIQTLRSARPHYGWLSEETPDTTDRQHAARTFIIDPIDGTRAFIEGQPYFAHSLAIAEGPDVIAGAVYLPALDQLFTASADSVALMNSVPIGVSAQTQIAGANVLTNKANLDPSHWQDGTPEFTRTFRSSLAYRLCLVAEGRHDAMLSFRPAWEWDIAAGALIAERAGATVSDGIGTHLRFNAPDPRAPGIIVASPGLHKNLLALRKNPA